MTLGSQRRTKVPGGRAIRRPFSWLSDGLGWRVRALLQDARRAKTALEIVLRRAVGFRESETKLIDDSQTYWNDPTDRSLKQNSHWRGVGIFADDSRWLALGREHFELYQVFVRAIDLKHPIRRIAEWGCGGGMNAVHFAPLADEFYGIDISSSSLEECGRQMTAAGLQNFTPVLVDAADPEAAIGQVQEPCDLFISTYVFELLPTPEYGIRVLLIAHKLLAPGGIAMIQIKYSEADAKTQSRAWAYASNLAWNATYRIEEFWQAAQQCGFSPKMVTLQPQQPMVNDRNYAYFLLQKKSAEGLR
jgi:cyclopropane fatty-acyl-phospholipid synthase-like methyltransferase